MTFFNCPSTGSATSTRVVFEPMSMAAQSIPGVRSMIPDSSDLTRSAWLRARVRRVLELPEQPGHDEGDLLADVDGVVADPLDRPRRQQHRHRPLAPVGVVADLERQPEAVAVEVVDDVVLANQVARHLDVA